MALGHPRQTSTPSSSTCPKKSWSRSCATTRSTSPSRTPTANSLPHFLAVLNTVPDSGRPSSATATSASCAPASTTPASSGRPTRSTRCAERVELLKHVTFQKDLGSYYDKTLRMQRLGSWLAATRPPGRHPGSSRRGPQGGAPGQDRSHHRTGQGVHRTAGHRRRPLRRVQQLERT